MAGDQAVKRTECIVWLVTRLHSVTADQIAENGG